MNYWMKAMSGQNIMSHCTRDLYNICVCELNSQIKWWWEKSNVCYDCENGRIRSIFNDAI